MKAKEKLADLALRSYKRSIKRLKVQSPDWKPISLEEYTNVYCKEHSNKNFHL